VDHFNKYPLISSKLSDFLLFKQCYDLIKQKQHLTQDGLEKIVALRCNLNKGLTDVLMEEKAFPNIVPVPRPYYKFNGGRSHPDPFWISGFISGDSTFCVSIEKSNNSKIGPGGARVRLIFGTCLHIRVATPEELLIGIANYFNILESSKEGLGTPGRDVEFNKNELLTSANQREKYIYDSEKRGNTLLQIKNYSDIVDKIIPFFNQYPILGWLRPEKLRFF
jgi:hypothetical protein